MLFFQNRNPISKQDKIISFEAIENIRTQKIGVTLLTLWPFGHTSVFLIGITFHNVYVLNKTCLYRDCAKKRMRFRWKRTLAGKIGTDSRIRLWFIFAPSADDMKEKGNIEPWQITAWRSLATICSYASPHTELGMAQPCHLVATMRWWQMDNLSEVDVF